MTVMTEATRRLTGALTTLNQLNQCPSFMSSFPLPLCPAFILSMSPGVPCPAPSKLCLLRARKLSLRNCRTRQRFAGALEIESCDNDARMVTWLRGKHGCTVRLAARGIDKLLNAGKQPKADPPRSL